ncbi:hypothetical protein [Nocardioides daphniae]|uniref:hypothetical protein n=1 Tax=Nocardioides daphniae TaxID=402297 RepID=UPI0013154FBF|nr:hypothetical protein [Nocardioides daphniae]
MRVTDRAEQGCPMLALAARSGDGPERQPRGGRSWFSGETATSTFFVAAPGG